MYLTLEFEIKYRTGMMGIDKKITVNHFRRKKDAGERIVCLTAYDAPSAKLAERAGVELILVGDSLGMVVLGYPNTIRVTLEQMLHHCAAVTRGTKNAFIVADMPFMTYQTCPEDAMRNAARCLREGGVDAVKVEGGTWMAPTIERLVMAGVPVMGHIGLLPQSVLTSGGYKVVGRTDDQISRLIEDAKAIEKAGAFCLVLECMPAETAAKITEAISIPTIGIGAGINCDGQIQVVHDILGLFPDFTPKHAKRYADIGLEIERAINAYAKDVRQGAFPGEENSF